MSDSVVLVGEIISRCIGAPQVSYGRSTLARHMTPWTGGSHGLCFGGGVV